MSIVPAEVEGRFLILGAGPAGHTAAMVAAELGAPVTIVEPSVLGGEAHLLDCIPSKTMVATSRRADSIRNAAKLGIVAEPGRVDLGDLATRIETIVSDLGEDVSEVLRRQGVQIIEGRGRLTSSHMASALTSDGEVEISFESGLIATGSSPRVPLWAEVDGERVMTTRHAYSLPALPEHLVIVGSGVTGVEFVHIFSSLGCGVTLIVSRQQVLPHYDPEVAAVLETEFLQRGVNLVKGAR
ncbi:MAG TPA: FAD-dependent oxidoreductase, partial [Acidimicrobiia bacterium]